jgi:hypothetical protein
MPDPTLTNVPNDNGLAGGIPNNVKFSLESRRSLGLFNPARPDQEWEVPWRLGSLGSLRSGSSLTSCRVYPMLWTSTGKPFL